MSEENSVWLVGADSPFIKTVVCESEEGAEAVLEDIDSDSVSASLVEFVPEGEEPEWHDFDKNIRQSEKKTWSELHKKAQD